MNHHEHESDLTLEGAKGFFEEYKMMRAKDDFMFRLGVLFAASLGLVTALAWEDAARSIFIYIFGSLDAISLKLLFAIIITLLAVVISLFVGKVARKRRK
jgi:predicted outer membrane lipoprotein